jgi:hypothetical protein
LYNECLKIMPKSLCDLLQWNFFPPYKI